MADSNCKCFLNDQLLPVRAGCEAIWCKDVNSHTAIREEALSRLADLQRQLQQAQEAGRVLSGKLLDAVTFGGQFKAERDAVIERGHDALWDAFEAYLKYYDGWQRQKRRAEAAEDKLSFFESAGFPTPQDALEKIEAAEALAEGLVTDIGHWVMAYGSDLVVYPSKEEIRAVNETPEFRIGRNATMQVVSEGLQAILKAPAEALRAVRAKHRTPPSGEHRSPQSGQARQEEGDEE